MNQDGWKITLDSEHDRIVLERTDEASKDLGPITDANVEWLVKAIRRQRAGERMAIEYAKFPQVTDADPMCLVLAEARNRKGIEPIDIARIIADDGADVVAWETGHVQPRLGTLRAWAYLLGYEPRMVLR